MESGGTTRTSLGLTSARFSTSFYVFLTPRGRGLGLGRASARLPYAEEK